VHILKRRHEKRIAFSPASRSTKQRLPLRQKEKRRLLRKGGVRDVFRHPWLDGRLQALRNLGVGLQEAPPLVRRPGRDGDRRAHSTSSRACWIAMAPAWESTASTSAS